VAGFLEREHSGAAWHDVHLYQACDYRDKGLKTESQLYRYVDDAPVKMPYNCLENVGCVGCISSTVRDLDKWTWRQLGRGEFEGRRIYSAEMAVHLHSPRMIIKPGEMFLYDIPEADFTFYGQGWFVR
jgi:hypothetical protein